MIRCAYPECQRNTAKYFMNWLDKDGKKQSGLVCASHDKILGRENLMKYAGMTLKETVAWEKENKKEDTDANTTGAKPCEPDSG